MAVEFFVRRGEVVTNLETAFDIRILSVKGLEPPQPKEPFVREWATENGIDIYYPATRPVKASKVVIECWAQEDALPLVKDRYIDLVSYLLEGEFEYFDTLRNSKVTCILESHSDNYHVYVPIEKIGFTLTLLNYSGAVTTYFYYS